MEGTSRSRDLRLLVHELRKHTYLALLEWVQHSIPALSCFDSWAGVAGYLQERGTPESDRDAVLRVILLAYRADRESEWLSILLAVFWPSLEVIYRRRRKWDVDGDEFWQNVHLAFLETAQRVDPEKRQDHLWKKIVNDTSHRLYKGYVPRWETANRERPSDNGTQPDIIDSRWRNDRQRVEQRCSLSWATKRGRVDKTTCQIINRTRVDEEPLSRCAEELGLSYETAKKRRQRGEARLHHYWRLTRPSTHSQD